MNKNINECHAKIKSVLMKFLQPKCRINNDVYLEMLLTHLSGKYDKEYKDISRSPCVTAWLQQSTSKFSNEHDSPCLSIVVFTLRLLAFVIEDEWQFAAIKEKHILDNIQTSLKNNSKLQTPSIKLANIYLLTAISKHSIGLHWIKQTSAWRPVIEYCQKNHTLYVVREAMTFLYDILHKFSNCIKDDQLTLEILKEICQDLPEKDDTSTSEISVRVDDSDYQQKLSPTLNLICYILQKCVESNEPNRISFFLLETFKLELKMWKLTGMTHDHIFLENILRVFVLTNFSRLECVNKDTTPDVKLNRFVVNFFNYMNFLISRGSSTNIFKMAELNHIMWKKLGNRVPEEYILENQKIKFEDQCIILQLLPIIFFIKKDHKASPNECVDEYVLKIFDISSEHTIRLCYAFRELLLTIENVDDLACKSIQGILSIKTVLHRDRAIMVFQALMYTLKGYAPEVCALESAEYKVDTETDRLASKPNLLSAILAGVHTLISHYKITWKECIESMTLLNFMLALLNNPNITTRLAVQVLKLTQLSIEHFLAPNLALLIDSLQGSAMEKLGPMIMKRLHDIDWEIRDSTLELLASMVSIANFKFPAFQQHILTNNICPVIFIMAKNDTEPYVRASALKCLTEMIKIKLFWEKCFSSIDIINHLLSVIGGESEGVVRREAVDVITELYEEQKIPRNYLDKVFSYLSYCSVNDLYWEVKTSGLNFWKTVLCRQCNHQGMIDGTFPTVTFSVEHKKIVTLTHKEIILRLKKLLDELSLRGGLGVLLACVDDECDIEVAKLAVKIVKKITDLLNKHNYIEDCGKLLSPTSEKISVLDTNYSEFKNLTVIDAPQIRNNADVPSDQTSSKLNSEEIIDLIVKSDDLNLLVSAYENQMNVNHLTESKIDENYYKKFYIQPNEFLRQVTEMNLDDKITSKAAWISETESFNSLLDDILLSFTDVESNDADCY